MMSRGYDDLTPYYCYIKLSYLLEYYFVFSKAPLSTYVLAFYMSDFRLGQLVTGNSLQIIRCGK
jgi:hypothetical protein